MERRFVSQNGYSLLELSLYLLFAGVTICGASVLHLGKLKKSTLNQQVFELAGLLRDYHLIAAQDEKTLSLTVNAHSLQLTSQAPNARLLIEQTAPPKIRYELRGNIRSISLYPNGVASPATLVIADGNNRCALTISLRGRVRESCDKGNV